MIKLSDCKDLMSRLDAKLYFGINGSLGRAGHRFGVCFVGATRVRVMQ